MFPAIVLESAGAPLLREVDDDVLSPGDVVVAVEASTLNYKDALAITGRAPIIRRFPLIPGIDLAGRVVHSESAAFAPGDAVVLNGWGVGESHTGGLAGRARVKSEWLVRLPGAFTAQQAMAIGTAGYTAMLCVLALERHGLAAGSELLVTGAAGGVGSVAVALLAGRGYRVVASTGRAGEAEYLMGLGAAEIVARDTLNGPGKPLARERWAGVVDTVGSHTLANALAATRYRGVVAACGLAQGMDLPGSVAPFILRGVTLVGIDSVMCPMPERLEAWRRLAADLDPGLLARMTTTIKLAEAIPAAAALLGNEVRGRVVVDVAG